MPETDPLLARIARSNPTIWPAQLLAYAAAAVLVALVAVLTTEQTTALAVFGRIFVAAGASIRGG